MPTHPSRQHVDSGAQGAAYVNYLRDRNEIFARVLLSTPPNSDTRRASVEPHAKGRRAWSLGVCDHGVAVRPPRRLRPAGRGRRSPRKPVLAIERGRPSTAAPRIWLTTPRSRRSAPCPSLLIAASRPARARPRLAPERVRARARGPTSAARRSECPRGRQRRPPPGSSAAGSSARPAAERPTRP